MRHLEILKSRVRLDPGSYALSGPVVNQVRKNKDIQGIFADENAYSFDPEQVVYIV